MKSCELWTKSNFTKKPYHILLLCNWSMARFGSQCSYDLRECLNKSLSQSRDTGSRNETRWEQLTLTFLVDGNVAAGANTVPVVIGPNPDSSGLGSILTCLLNSWPTWLVFGWLGDSGGYGPTRGNSKAHGPRLGWIQPPWDWVCLEGRHMRDKYHGVVDPKELWKWAHDGPPGRNSCPGGKKYGQKQWLGPNIRRLAGP